MSGSMRSADLPRAAQDELSRLDRLVGAGKHAQAIEGLTRFVLEFPSAVTALFLLGLALRMTGDGRRSAAAFRRAAEVDPDHSDAILGLAWIALDERRLDEAEARANRLQSNSIHRGNALAILARVKEARGDERGAAGAFLAAYQASPMWSWLGEHCRLTGRRFISPGGHALAPWPIAAPLRPWLYATIEAELCAVAAKLPSPPPAAQQLTAGCDHTPGIATEWAERHGVDVVDLYQAMATRGGFCDCEVVLNAAQKDDDELETVLLAGRLSGPVARRVIEAFGDLLVLDRAPHPVSADRLSIRAEELFGIEEQGALELPPQQSSGTLLGQLLLVAGDVLPRDGELTLFTLWPDGRERGHVVRYDAAGLSVRELGDPLPPEAAPLATGLPVDAPIDGRRRLAWPARGDSPRLLLSGETWLACRLDRPEPVPFGERPMSLALHPPTGRIAWLVPNRKRFDLIVEDREAGFRRRLATGRFDGGTVSFPGVAFSPDGAHVICCLDREIVELGIDGGQRALGPGLRGVPSPDGRLLAIVDAMSDLRILDRADGSEVMMTEGRNAVWSPDGRTLVFGRRTADEGHQLFVWSRGSSIRRISPPGRSADWPSFTGGGRQLVFYAVVARRQHPVAGGKVRVEEDERIFSVPVDGTREPVALLAYDDSTMRIRRPLAHPELPIVAYATQDGPMQNRRVAILDEEGRSTDLLAVDRTPAAWLPDDWP
jgi:tetratricopeptide (TPR) repeat protein